MLIINMQEAGNMQPNLNIDDFCMHIAHVR